MSYQCQTCSYRGSRFPEGACPACGSRKVARTADKQTRPRRTRKPFLLLFCIALWLYLIVDIYRKLS